MGPESLPFQQAPTLCWSRTTPKTKSLRCSIRYEVSSKRYYRFLCGFTFNAEALCQNSSQFIARANNRMLILMENNENDSMECFKNTLLRNN